MDNTLTAVNLAACVAYLLVAAGRVYGGGAAARVVKALLLSAAVGLIVLGYRFVVFVITLYTVRPRCDRSALSSARCRHTLRQQDTAAHDR